MKDEHFERVIFVFSNSLGQSLFEKNHLKENQYKPCVISINLAYNEYKPLSWLSDTKKEDPCNVVEFILNTFLILLTNFLFRNLK